MYGGLTWGGGGEVGGGRGRRKAKFKVVLIKHSNTGNRITKCTEGSFPCDAWVSFLKTKVTCPIALCS